MSQTLHDSPVVDLKCRTEDPGSFNTKNVAWHKDELTVLFANALVNIDGLSLFQTLRACRNQLAKSTWCRWVYLLFKRFTYTKLHFSIWCVWLLVREKIFSSVHQTLLKAGGAVAMVRVGTAFSHFFMFSFVAQ